MFTYLNLEAVSARNYSWPPVGLLIMSFLDGQTNMHACVLTFNVIIVNDSCCSPNNIMILN